MNLEPSKVMAGMPVVRNIDLELEKMLGDMELELLTLALNLRLDLLLIGPIPS